MQNEIVEHVFNYFGYKSGQRMLKRLIVDMFKVFCQNTRIFPRVDIASLLLRRKLLSTARCFSQNTSPPSSSLTLELLQDESHHLKQPVRKKPNECSVLLFPGQGSQFVGMGQGLLKYKNVREMFDVAQKILGYDLLSLCLNGPEEELNKTIHCQPAVFVTSLAAVERLVCEKPEAIEDCVAAAGFSVGEFAALVFAGAMDFEEALYVVKVRAEAMQEASDRTRSGMLSVVGLPKASYSAACLQAREHCRALGVRDPVCTVASYLFPDGRVIAGHQEALDFLQENARALHFLRARPLPVSGAFHSALMEPAAEALRQALSHVTVRRPLVAVHANVDGKRYAHQALVRRLLPRQLVSPVRWEQTLQELYARERGRGLPHTYEVGPGRQLGATLRRCNLKAFRSYTHVDGVAPQD